MKILAVADDEAKRYYDYYQPDSLKEFDMIISCGDLHKVYLEFLVTMGNIPLLYVHGNHDEGMEENPPKGCICIDDRLVVVNGVRVVGLGGSYQYRKGRYMYTEWQMWRRVIRLLPAILLHGGFDILVTHAPARHINDFDSNSHRGFQCFHFLIKHFRPKYLIHGHIHKNYGVNIPQVTQNGETTVINAYEYCALDYGEDFR